MMNKMGYTSFDDVLKKGNVAINVDTFKEMAEHEGALVLDVRSKEDFTAGHIPGSIFIGIDGGFAPWVGALIPDLDQPIILVAPQGREEETVTRLSRVGYDNTLGYLEGGFEAWKNSGKETDHIESITAEELAKIYDADNKNIVDIRKEGEYLSEHVDGAKFMPLDYINDNFKEWNGEETQYVHCASGYRSLIFASIMKSRGHHNIVDVAGGFKAIKETDISVTDYVCPSTL